MSEGAYRRQETGEGKMKKCRHENIKFLAVSDYRGYIEKMYQCEDCGIPIFDFGTEKELNLYLQSRNYQELGVGQNNLKGNDLRRYL